MLDENHLNQTLPMGRGRGQGNRFSVSLEGRQKHRIPKPVNDQHAAAEPGFLPGTTGQEGAVGLQPQAALTPRMREHWVSFRREAFGKSFH